LNYVIQNFYKTSFKTTNSPRLRLLMITNNLTLIFFFFKYFSQTRFFTKILELTFMQHFLFLKHFYNKQIFKLKKKINFKITGLYDNKLFKSFIYKIFKNFILIFKFSKLNYFYLPINQFFSYNLYFLTINVLQQKLIKTYYRNFFFFILFFSTLNWFSYNNSLQFYLHYFYTFKNFKFYVFFGNYFLKTFNY
jgi:hypothetical protein